MDVARGNIEDYVRNEESIVKVHSAIEFISK
jgi:hypothetical protein